METLIREGRLFTSKPELELGKWLISVFGENNIKKQSWIARQSIDYYVKNIGVYVQLDGIYWHGLMGEKHVNAGILKTVARDKRLNDWFNASDKKLFRLTDAQWNEVKKQGDYSPLEQQLIVCQKGVTLFVRSIAYGQEQVDNSTD